MTRFKKIDSCVYEYRDSGYLAEKMADGRWDAYLPNAFGDRLWQSVKHRSRESAAMAISLERRRIRNAVSEALAVNS